MNGGHGRLLPALLISAAAHGAIIAALPGAPERPERGGRGPLKVALVKVESEGGREGPAPPTPAENRTSHRQAAEPKSAEAATTGESPHRRRQSEPRRTRPERIRAGATDKAPHQKQPAGARQTEATNETQDSPPTAAVPKQTETGSAAAGGGAEIEGDRALQRQLSHALARYFQYPPLARRRGWEGRVLLELEISPRGDVGSAQVISSSGHALLDRAALRAAERIGRLPDAARWLNGNARRLRLPVIYRLREG